MSAISEDHVMLDRELINKQISDQSGEDGVRDKFVAYVQALSGCEADRYEVWSEHSYSRARRSSGPQTPQMILVRRPPPALDPLCDEDMSIDVVAHEEPPQPPVSPRQVPAYEQALSEEDIEGMNEADGDLEDWEDKLDALAPSVTHKRLVSSVIEIIRSLRTACLAGGENVWGATRSHARRLRRELAPLWNHPGPLQQRPAAWMHAVLSAYLPRPYLHIYNDMISELARVVPKLAERLLAGQVTPAGPELAIPGARVKPSSDKSLMVWIPSGREKRDAMWENYMGQVLPVHRINAPNIKACTPEAWCTAMAVATRSALNSLTVPHSDLILAGWGAGAALAVYLATSWDPAAGPAPKALVLLSPPLLTAEGPRDSLDDPILQLKMPILFVIGQNAMQSTVSMAEEARERLGRRARLVVVGAADDCLRVSQFKLRSERVTHSMIYAALAEEVRSFAIRSLISQMDCGESDVESEPPAELETPPPAPPPRRRHTHANTHKYGLELTTSPAKTSPASTATVSTTASSAHPTPSPSPPAQISPSAGKGRGLALLRVSSSPIETSTLAQASSSGRTTTDWEEALSIETHQQKRESRQRNIRITENVIHRGSVLNGANNKGFVVTRGTGSTPLSLPLPRRSAPPPPTLNSADIMKLPIVFADDNQLDLTEEPVSAQTPPQPSPTQGHASAMHMGMRQKEGGPLQYTKVILAKRPTPVALPRPIIVKGGMKPFPKGLVIKRRPIQRPRPEESNEGSSRDDNLTSN